VEAQARKAYLALLAFTALGGGGLLLHAMQFLENTVLPARLLSMVFCVPPDSFAVVEPQTNFHAMRRPVPTVKRVQRLQASVLQLLVRMASSVYSLQRKAVLSVLWQHRVPQDSIV
jgi:hypothetical protein